MIKSEIAKNDVAEVAGLQHKAYVPSDIAHEAQPCLLMVHGRAGNFGVMWVFSKAVGETRPVIVAPQAHLEDPIGGNSWWQIGQDPTCATYPECELSEMYLGEPLEKLSSFIDSLPELYNVDPNRIVAIGFSQGAGLISAMSVARPGVFRGMGLLSGFVPKTVAYQLKKAEGRIELPETFMFHGTQDKIIPFERAQADSEVLKGAGANIVFESDSVSHKVSSAGIKALASWYQGLSL